MLYWIGYSNWMRSAAGILAASFNPCCIGLGIQTKALYLKARFPKCFNPCCIGLGIQTIVSGRMRVRLRKGFNPCCIGLGIQTCRLCCCTRSNPRVSILVVLDWVFKPATAPQGPAYEPVFQSLLYWIGYSNDAPIRRPARRQLFQSLLYWIGYSNHAYGPVYLSASEAFQSLLYWIGYSNSLAVWLLLGLSLCFNPCCIGLGIQTLVGVTALPEAPFVSILVVLDWVFKPAHAVRKFAVLFWFQSLLYWIGYSNWSGSNRRPSIHGCFNPCCIGLGIQTPAQGKTADRPHRFQSLLYWIGYSNGFFCSSICV